MNKIQKLTLSLLAAAALTANATTVSYTAQQGTGLSDLNGTELTGTLVEIGYLNTGIFTSLGSTTTGNPLPNGMFGGSVLFDSSSLTSAQPALQLTSSDGGSIIAYATSWAFSAGDGTGTDTSSDAFDLANVAIGGSLTASGVVVANSGSTFNLNGATNSSFNQPSISFGLDAVPEPSTYALLAGALAFAFVAIRRRK
jgi:hypothetical protein